MALTPAEKQAAYRARQRGLEAARALGRRLGEAEADVLESRGSPLADRVGRVARAEGYAVWVASGKPWKGEV